MNLKRIAKRIAAPALCAMLAVALSACSQGGNAEKQTEEVKETKTQEAAAVIQSTEAADEKENTEEEAASEEETPSEEEPESEKKADEPSYVTIYRNLVSEMSDTGVADQFILAQIDDDEIPELLATSSEGPFDRENTFIYTVYEDEPVLLASAIAGVDGASLSYSDKGMIRQTGSLTGRTEVYSRLADGALTEEFRAKEMTEPDADGEDVFVYSVNGEEVTPEEYEMQLSAFVTENGPFMGIDYDGLSVLEFENGRFSYMHQLAYWTAEDTLSTLDSMGGE